MLDEMVKRANDDCEQQVSLVLIGQVDRYDEARRRGASVVEICQDDHAQPTAAEARQIVDVLRPFAYGVQPGIDDLLGRLRVLGGLQTDEEAQALADAEVRESAR